MASVHLAPVFRLLETYVPNFDVDQASKFVDWFVVFRHPLNLWKDQPYFLLMECMTIFIVLLNYIHAKRVGGRFVNFWWATMVISLVTECVCYFVPFLNNFWHSQSMVMFIGQRYPLYIVIMFGLLGVLMDVPYDIMGVKMLWWSWHDTDPTIVDRFYSVPWTSFHFHCAFAAALTLVFLGAKAIIGNKWERGNFFVEQFILVLAGILGMPLGSLFFTIFYHPMKDHFGIHSEVPVLMFLATCLLIVWTADRYRSPKSSKGRAKSAAGFNEVFVAIVLYYAYFMTLVVIAKPESVMATGMHQQIGLCSVKEVVPSLAGKDLLREKYLCPTKYNEPYFDWHCLPKKAPPMDARWYTMCGTPFENHKEYIAIVWFFSILGLIVFTQLMLCGNPGAQKHQQPQQGVQKQSKPSKKYYAK